jgi:hypothetical protein
MLPSMTFKCHYTISQVIAMLTSFSMRAFAVDHCGHPALGYVLVSRSATGLKKEYQSLDKSALRDLAKTGVQLQSDPIENVEVAYTGDTCASGLTFDPSASAGKSVLYKQQLFQAEVILCELTYLDSTDGETGRQRAVDRGHLHICELERIFASIAIAEDGIKPDESTETISNCVTIRQRQHIIFYHLSGRSSPATRALDMIANGLPRYLRSRCHVAVASLLSADEKNSLGRLIQPNGCISLHAYLAWRERPK